jgi:predicted lipoprotein with Yx(FWY)xxD motif
MERRVHAGISPAHRVTIVIAVAATVAALVLLVLLLSRGSRPSDENAAAARPPAPTPSLEVRRTKLGRILTDQRGRTLYLFEKDTHGRSTCFDACARVWPPALVRGRPRAGEGVAVSKLTTTRRGSSKRQLVYAGHPLYRMNADVRPGQTQGEGFLATWWIVSPSGHRIVAPGMSTKAGGY